ncbi:uncharacterized protein TNCV_1141291, partial [Trichonephila clavipes]
IPREKKSCIVKSGKRGGQSPLERTPSSKNSVNFHAIPFSGTRFSVLVQPSVPFITLSKDINSVMMFILTDGLLNGLLCKAVSTSATFFFTMDALPYRFLSITDPVSRNRCSKRVVGGAFGAVSPGYFCFDVGLSESGVLPSALWHGGDWLVDGIRKAWQTWFIRMGDVQSFLAWLRA